MALIRVNNFPVITYDWTTLREKYWTELSKNLIEKYGNQRFTESIKVEEILIDGFQYFVEQFRTLILSDVSYRFFVYTFHLHEESIKLYRTILEGYTLNKTRDKIDDNEFAIYRRILKLILEQGCDIDLQRGSVPTKQDFWHMNDKIQNLIYLGTWIYSFAELIAFQKMVEDCHSIEFDESNLLMIDWQYHYGKTYIQLFPMLRDDYSKGTYDENAIDELIATINKCFSVDYNFARGIIFEIKKHFNPQDPTFQTIQPEILPSNLAREYGISLDVAEKFYAGLSITRHNKLSIEGAILKPHSTQRYIFRPILIYNIDGENRALVGEQKFVESITVLSTNAIHWNAMLKEWLSVKGVQAFINKKGDEHDKILEDEIEKIIKDKGFIYCRNIKTFKQPSGINLRIDNELAGEIDFIIINKKLKVVFIADAKYNKTKYEAVGYKTDNSNFINSYEPQLLKKVDWLSMSLQVLQDHLKITNNLKDLDITDFRVEGIFLINTPTFYMFNGKYKAITLKQIGDFLDGKYEYPTLIINEQKGDNEQLIVVQHPYFKKPNI
ncbi:MAG: hypothetical protein AB9833_07750 [Bacteroidales bacterium]